MSATNLIEDELWIEVKPVLSLAGAETSVVVTGHAGHAAQLMQDLRPEDWEGLLIVSGDGLLYEVRPAG